MRTTLETDDPALAISIELLLSRKEGRKEFKRRRRTERAVTYVQ